MTQIAAFLARLVSLYTFFIWIRIIMSWFNPYPAPGSFTWYFSRMVDPYLNLFRSRNFIVGHFDFSALLAVGVLAVVQSLLEIFSWSGTMRLSWVVQMVLSAFWTYALQVFLMILIIMLVIRTISSFSHSPNLSRMNGITENIIRRTQQLFFPSRIVRESTLCIIALVIAVLSYFAGRYLISLLITFAARIPL